MLEIMNELEINASTDHVWSVLTQRDRYQEWNSVIHSQIGDMRRGCRARMKIKPLPGPTLDVGIIYQEVCPERGLSWYGGPPLFKGLQYFKLKALANGKTQLIHGERFDWLAALLAWPLLITLVKERYRNADIELQRRCEAAKL